MMYSVLSPALKGEVREGEKRERDNEDGRMDGGDVRGLLCIVALR